LSGLLAVVPVVPARSTIGLTGRIWSRKESVHVTAASAVSLVPGAISCV
jgi:hypothetical protein